MSLSAPVATHDPETDPLTGTMVGNFVLGEVIGEGGQGKIYRGIHHILHQTAAVKILDKRFLPDGEAARRFHREARLLMQLKHKHIVQMLDFGRLPNQKQLYLVMEYLEGASLSEHLAQQQTLALPRIRTLFAQLCEALAFIHQQGVIHRDIKPANVFLQTHPTGDIVKLIDFGIAGLEESEDSLTTEGVHLGTAKYMSPEQAKGTKDVDARSDIYSLGTCLVRLLTGQVPFKGAGILNIVHQVVSRPAPALSELSPYRQWSPELEAFIQSALAKDPADRPQTAIGFWEQCERALLAQEQFEGTGGPPDTWPHIDNQTTKNRDARARQPSSATNTRVAILAGLFACVIAGLVLWALRSPNSPTTRHNAADASFTRTTAGIQIDASPASHPLPDPTTPPPRTLPPPKKIQVNPPVHRPKQPTPRLKQASTPKWKTSRWRRLRRRCFRMIRRQRRRCLHCVWRRRNRSWSSLYRCARSRQSYKRNKRNKPQPQTRQPRRMHPVRKVPPRLRQQLQKADTLLDQLDARRKR
jgi:serine/threonine protein kinase